MSRHPMLLILCHWKVSLMCVRVKTVFLVFGFYFHLFIVLKTQTKLCFLVALCLISDWRLTEHRLHVTKGHHEVTTQKFIKKHELTSLWHSHPGLSVPAEDTDFFKRCIKNAESFPQTLGHCSF